MENTGTKRAAWKVTLDLRGYGRGTLRTAAVDCVSARKHRVELSRAGGAIVEWYENSRAGLEQGFTVLDAPPGTGPLRLILDTAGDLDPELDGSLEQSGLRVLTDGCRWRTAV